MTFAMVRTGHRNERLLGNQIVCLASKGWFVPPNVIR